MNKKIVILGARESGIGAALLAQQNGFDVFVSDAGVLADSFCEELNNINVEWEQGQHSIDKILQANLVVKSPGIPTTAKILNLIKQAHIPLISEVEFGYKYVNEDAKIIAITGSNGKTTTTLWTQHILQEANYDSIACGNIGYSFCRAIATKPAKYYVLELSSFQLDDIVDFCPDTAILLNITPDHLDRYDDDFNKYVAAKFKIIKNQNEQHNLIFNADDEVIVNHLENLKSSTNKFGFALKNVEAKHVVTSADDKQIFFNTHEKKLSMVITNLGIAGLHNVQNAMSAGSAAQLADVNNEALTNALSTFSNVEHRMEKVRSYGGVTFINDSKATNVNSVWYALESIETSIVWLVGGTDKGNDYDLLKPLVIDKVDAIICIGLDNSKIKEEFKDFVDHIVEIQDMKTAVTHAFDISDPGGVVLLSPACASFDFYKNYEDRGKQFTRAAIEVRRKSERTEN